MDGFHFPQNYQLKTIQYHYQLKTIQYHYGFKYHSVPLFYTIALCVAVDR